MLGLIRRHEIIEDIINDWDCTYSGRIIHTEAEWEIGKFKTFKDIENYLVKYHNYEIFDDEDKELILLTVGECGICNLPVYRSTEYLDDGETQIRFRVIRN